MLNLFNREKRKTVKFVRMLMKRHEELKDYKIAKLLKTYQTYKQKDAIIAGLISINADLEESKRQLILGAYRNGAKSYIEQNFPDELAEILIN